MIHANSFIGAISFCLQMERVLVDLSDPEVTKAFVTRTVATSILGVWGMRSSMAEGLQSSRWIAGRA